MKTKISIGFGVFFIASLLSLTASAQGNTRVGLGVSIDPFAAISGLGVIGGSDLRIPVGIGESVQVEPYFGMAISSDKAEVSDQDSEASEGVSNIRFGTGIFYRFRFTDASRAYVGPQVGLIMAGTSEDVTSAGQEASGGTSQMIIHLGLCAGGEHFFDPRFSIGGEIQVNYDIAGDVTAETSGEESLLTYTYDTDDVYTEGRSSLYTRALVLVRWYFMGT